MRTPSQSQQAVAYELGRLATGVYVNPYSTDTEWLLFLAYEQGHNVEMERRKGSELPVLSSLLKGFFT